MYKMSQNLQNLAFLNEQVQMEKAEGWTSGKYK